MATESPLTRGRCDRHSDHGEFAALETHDVKQPCRVGHQGRIRPLFDGAMGASSRRAHAESRPAGALFRVGRARSTGVSIETSVRRLCPPYEESRSLFSSFHLCFLLLPAHHSLFAFPIRHPDEGMAERRQAPGRCEHPVGRAMTGTRAPCFRRPALPAIRKRPPLGAPPWRFCGPGLCSPLSGIPSGIERRPCSTPGSS
jgi:hypothetical protein